MIPVFGAGLRLDQLTWKDMFGCIQYWGRYLESWDPETLWIVVEMMVVAKEP